MKATNFLQTLKKLNQEDLESVKGIGPILAQNFVEFLASSRFEKLQKGFEKLQQENLGLEIIQETPKTGLALSLETICITGSFDISRDEIKEKLESLGAKVVSQVSSSTTILLAGEKAGSKLQKAQKLGLKVLEDYKILL